MLLRRGYTSSGSLRVTLRNGYFKSQIAASGLKNYEHWNSEERGAFSASDSHNDVLSLPKHVHNSK